MPDILISERLPTVPWYFPDLCLLAQIVYNIFFTKNFHLRSFFALNARLLFMRSLVVWVTSIPEVDEFSHYQLWEVNDIMFSGHTATLLSASFDPISYCISAVGGLFLIMGRQHYTMDVLISVFLTEVYKKSLWRTEEYGKTWCLRRWRNFKAKDLRGEGEAEGKAPEAGGKTKTE